MHGSDSLSAEPWRGTLTGRRAIKLCAIALLAFLACGSSPLAPKPRGGGGLGGGGGGRRGGRRRGRRWGRRRGRGLGRRLGRRWRRLGRRWRRLGRRWWRPPARG